MQVTCQICGRKHTLAAWSEEYEKLKSAPQHPYICHTCQEKIRSEAARDQER